MTKLTCRDYKSDEIIIARALERTCAILGRNSNHRSASLRSSLEKFLIGGERDFGILAGMAIKIELCRLRDETNDQLLQIEFLHSVKPPLANYLH